MFMASGPEVAALPMPSMLVILLRLLEVRPCVSGASVTVTL